MWRQAEQKEMTDLWRGYDPTKREPLYAGADRVGLWELRELASHYHPTVAKFAREILAGNDVHYESDPLLDFSFSAFLDRFVYEGLSFLSSLD